MAECYLCGSTESRLEAPRVRDAEIPVRACNGCGLVFLESASHIGPGFYEKAGMHAGSPDLAGWRRETASDDERRAAFCAPMMVNRRLLDFGCGNGGFLLRAAPLAASAAGVDLERSAAPALQAAGVTYAPHLEDLDGTFDLITAFHVVEHLSDPRATIAMLLARLSPGGRLIIEVPNSDDALLRIYASEAFKAFTYWSCHLFLFNATTLRTLVEQAGGTAEFVRHLQRFPVSNHLHWLSRGRPGGHAAWAFLDSPRLAEAYADRLAAVGSTDTLLACVTRT